MQRDSHSPSLRPAPVASALLASALSAALFPGLAHAADAADVSARDDIVVIGIGEPDANPNANEQAPYKVERSADGKFTEPLRDTPKTIVAIPKEVVEDIGATTFREVVRSQPGVTLGTGEGGNAFGDRIFIRGFDARNDIYIDGLRDPGVSSREIFAVEQIEVVKGPSSAFGGRGTTGGAVSLQSKRPQFKNFLVAEGGVGTDDYYRTTLDVNRKLSDSFAIRLNGLYHNADTPGRDHVGSERWGVAASAIWKPVDNFSITADYYYYRLDGMSDYGQPFDVTTQQPYRVNRDNFYGAVGRDFLKNGSDIGTVTLQYEPSDALSLRSTTRYGKTYNYYVVSVPRAPRVVSSNPARNAADLAAGFTPGQLVVDTGTPQRHGDNEALEHISDATFRFGTGGLSHTLVTGIEAAHEKVTNRRYAFPGTVEDANGNIISTPGGFTRDLFNPDPVLGYSIPAILDASTPATVVDVKTMSAFLLDTVKFSPQWQMLLGVRYDSFDIRASGPNRDGSLFTRKSSPAFFNYQASLVYKPVEAATLYASFSTSSNPSGEQLDSVGADYGGLADGLQNLKPERNKAYELGAKYELNGGQLLLTGALFQIDKDNARERDPVSGSYQLVGKLRSRGAEVGLSGNITPRLAVFGGFTYLDAKIIESETPANVGSRFPNVPKYNVSLLGTYKLTDDFLIGGQAYYQSNMHGGTYASTSATVPGYWRFDAVTRLRVSQHVELRANVLNLTDKRYYDAIYRSSAPFAYVAPGRSATFTVAASF